MGYRGVVPYMFGVKYSTVNQNDTALYCSNKYGILFFIPRPCNPRVILSEAAHRV